MLPFSPFRYVETEPDKTLPLYFPLPLPLPLPFPVPRVLGFLEAGAAFSEDGGAGVEVGSGALVGAGSPPPPLSPVFADPSVSVGTHPCVKKRLAGFSYAFAKL